MILRILRTCAYYLLGVWFFVREFTAALIDTCLLGKSPEEQMRDSMDE